METANSIILAIVTVVILCGIVQVLNYCLFGDH